MAVPPVLARAAQYAPAVRDDKPAGGRARISSFVRSVRRAKKKEAKGLLM
jgi:hypothetical protein